ncbi:MAG: Dihydrolipoyllysine-residue acetyltransferase component of pyruvate dehydrogenase complex [candidate division BRC1 bacterium ADurb.BinA292]|nr:MAG: Dihydrolipoyllysine-residue acetyltransferase component of pyruvate dehydrogenase complex [candidate division BRC1 bacterium ADurb.BinA292]
MIRITMPQAGQTMEDGTVVRWLKREGDAVAPGDVLLEIETDKSTLEVESVAGGTLRRILAPEGTTLPVHAPLAIVGDPNEDIEEAVEQAREELKRQAPADGPAPTAPPAPRESPGAKPATAESTPEPDPTPAAAASVVPILMPQAGQSMEEGTIVKWRVAPGDQVKVGDILFDVETDKSVVEVEATDAGRLARILVPEGATVPVKRPVAYLAEHDADVDAWLKAEGAASGAPAGAAPPPAPVSSAPPAGAVVPVLMPQAGQSMEEGTIVKWRVAPGAEVKPGDILFEVETDKSVVEVEATDAGRLARIVVGEGGTIEVKKPVAYLADHDADVDAYLAAGGETNAPEAGDSLPRPVEAHRETAPAAAETPAPAAVEQPLLSADGFCPVLAASQDDSASAVALDSADQRDDA